MKRVRYLLPLTFAAFALTLAARPCGPDFAEAVFVLQTGPGGDYAAYVGGDIGVPQQDYRTRHLILAYDDLSGHPLSAAVQKEAVEVNNYLLDPYDADNRSGTPLPGYDAWIKARDAFGAVDGYTPDASLTTVRSVPGEDYSDFKNCLDDAFATAGKTLAARVTTYTAKSPAVIDWVRGQDAVFSNCGDGKVSNYFGPAEKAPAPPPSPRTPAATPAEAPLWLKQDRAYQLAAASFYHLDFENAASRFRAIAADQGSPWSVTARYLIARSYVRTAMLMAEPPGTDVDEKAAQQRRNEALAKARRELDAMRGEPRMAVMRSAIDGLSDYVNLRLQPDAQAAVLAARLQTPIASSFRQATLDLTWLHAKHGYVQRPALNSAPDPNDMLAWLDAVSNGNEASAIEHWHRTHSTTWLVAAVSYAKTGEPDVPELIRAAKLVSESNPGWLALTYHRLRLSPPDLATRGEVLALLPRLKGSADTSRLNLFLGLSTSTATSLNDWITSLPRVPAGDDSDGSSEGILQTPTPTADVGSTQAASPEPIEDVCGTKFPAGTILPLFDTDAAAVFNLDMPLRLLAKAAEASGLPENLRFQVAQATWARAVLLDKPEVARSMTHILEHCRPAWKPVLIAYDGAITADARHASGLLALMRFASTVPSVWEGNDRRAGFATYDEFRENWWCSAVPRVGQTVDFDPDRAASPSSQEKASAPPPFLTQADLTEAHIEVAALQQVPRASTYFAQQALAWQSMHPNDPQTPEILGEADRVIRNSCRKDPPLSEHVKPQSDPGDMTLTPNLSKALFDNLQRNYPNSPWAKRYKTWE